MTERIQENSLTVPVKKEQKERQDFILRAAGLKLRGGRGSHKRAKTEGVGWVTVGDRSKQEGLGGASRGSRCPKSAFPSQRSGSRWRVPGDAAEARPGKLTCGARLGGGSEASQRAATVTRSTLGIVSAGGTLRRYRKGGARGGE